MNGGIGMEILSHGCTLDCWDTCKFNVYFDDGKIVKIEGDKEHPFTKGIICIKGRKHLERLYHKDRILSPMKKENGEWIEISFDEAVTLIKEKLLYIREEFGSNSVLHYSQSGSNGILKGIGDVFFNFFGGITLGKGSTCWGAGIRAQQYDFGNSKSHSLEDMYNSKNIILWGRNPVNTSIHLTYAVKEAKKRGVNVITIDPINTDSAKLADKYIRINPSTDGALAMAMSKVIIDANLIDADFISNNVIGFKEYREYLNSLDLEFLSKETGLKVDEIEELAFEYAKGKPSTIYPGYGLQKYRNGGNTIRAIDALASITGNIGINGGGVNYANRVYSELLNKDPYNSSKYAVNERYFQVHDFSDYILEENGPPIKAIFITKANPLSQLPNLNKTKKSFQAIEFKVCFDMFMTDTAMNCDLFIPCTNTLESEDLLTSGMSNPYLIYNQRIVTPADRLMDEYYFFMRLAKEMEIEDYPFVTKKEYLNKVIEPLMDKDITLDSIREGYFTAQTDEVPWRDLSFDTTSKKIEISSNQAKDEGLSPYPIYIKSEQQGKVRLISGHFKDSLFSQHFLDIEGISKAYINENMSKLYDLENGDKAILTSEKGQIEVHILLSEDVPNNIIYMHTGWWEKHGNPNFLTANISSEMGGQIAYYEVTVAIEKSPII